MCLQRLQKMSQTLCNPVMRSLSSGGPTPTLTQLSKRYARPGFGGKKKAKRERCRLVSGQESTCMPMSAHERALFGIQADRQRPIEWRHQLIVRRKSMTILKLLEEPPVGTKKTGTYHDDRGNSWRWFRRDLLDGSCNGHTCIFVAHPGIPRNHWAFVLLVFGPSQQPLTLVLRIFVKLDWVSQEDSAWSGHQNGNDDVSKSTFPKGPFVNWDYDVQETTRTAAPSRTLNSSTISAWCLLIPVMVQVQRQILFGVITFWENPWFLRNPSLKKGKENEKKEPRPKKRQEKGSCSYLQEESQFNF